MRNFLPQVLYSPEGDGGAAALPSGESVSTPDAGVDPGASATPNDDVGFTQLGEDFSDGEFDRGQVLAPPPKPQVVPAQDASPAQVPPASQPQQTPPPPAVQPQKDQTTPPPVQTSPQGQTVPPAQAATSGEASRDPLAELIDTFTKSGPELLDTLAKTRFALTAEEIEGLQTDAATAVPKLLAKAHLNATQTALHYMQNLVPGMIQRQVAELSQQMQYETGFFQQFPQLNRTSHANDIKAISQAIRAQNPSMPVDEVLAQTGRAVMAIHGITAAPPAQGTAKANGAAGKPAFVPAIPGPARAVTSQTVEPFAGLGVDFPE